MSDELIRGLSRRLEETSDPRIAGRLLFEAFREGRWLSGHDVYKIGTLRFLAHLGWKAAVHLLQAVPATTLVRGRKPPAVAYSEIGEEVAKDIAPTVLEAAAAAGCMAVAHLLPGFDAQAALDAYEDAKPQGEGSKAAFRVWGMDPVNGPLGRSLAAIDASADRPDSRALRSARHAWTEFLHTVGRREDMAPGMRASSLFWTTYALAWECEPERSEVELQSMVLPDTHWSRATIAKLKWSDTRPGTARPSLHCMRDAKAKLREAVRGPAMVAAATLVS